MKSEQLRAAFKLKMIEKSPDITLTGIDAIAHFFYIDPSLMLWHGLIIIRISGGRSTWK